MILNSPLKALHDDQSECYGAILILFSYLCFLGYRNNDGHLEASGDSSRERLNISVNTPASWSVYALRMWLWMPSLWQPCEAYHA
jgi:hypothetical protein